MLVTFHGIKINNNDLHLHIDYLKKKDENIAIYTHTLIKFYVNSFIYTNLKTLIIHYYLERFYVDINNSSRICNYRKLLLSLCKNYIKNILSILLK